MNTYELASPLNRATQLKHLHGQVCDEDLLPEEKPLDVKAYIINTDTSDKPGEHWVAIYFRNNGEAIYVDSRWLYSTIHSKKCQTRDLQPKMLQSME